MTVREYEEDFVRLSKFVGRIMNEYALVRRFLRDLRIKLQNLCKMSYYRNMIELVKKASNLEIRLKIRDESEQNNSSKSCKESELSQVVIMRQPNAKR